MIGPLLPDEGAAVLTRPLETVEVAAPGDTLRHRAAAATVALEFLPPLRRESLERAVADSAAPVHPAATYALSGSVRLAAYESCATSRLGPRVRYLRRDQSGRIVTDVLLQRTSER